MRSAAVREKSSAPLVPNLPAVCGPPPKALNVDANDVLADFEVPMPRHSADTPRKPMKRHRKQWRSRVHAGSLRRRSRPCKASALCHQAPAGVRPVSRGIVPTGSAGSAVCRT